MSFRRIVVAMVCCLALICTSLEPANAFMEKVGKETADGALEKLKAMGDHFVSEIFDNGNRLIDRLMNEASNERKSAVAQVGSEFHYAVESLTAKFGREVNGNISHASTELQNNLAVLLAWTGSLEDVTKNLASLEDDFAIDIQSLPFATKYFSIRRVSGLNILQGERSTYPIRITGERFGRPDSSEVILVKAIVGDTPLSEGAIIGPNQIEFRIPASLLEKYFKSGDASLIDLKVSATREQKNCWYKCTEETSGTFKLLLAPETIGKLEIQIRRAIHEWKPWESVTRQFAIKSPSVLALDPLAEIDGKQRRYAQPTITCSNIKRDAWRLPNGHILLPGDKLLIDGWTSSSWVGANQGKDLETFDSEAKRDLGFTTGFYANNSCAGGKRCQISADTIRSNSTKLNELGHCDIMKVAAVDLSPDRERGTVTIVGTAEHESLFEIKTPIETFELVGFEAKPAETKIKDVKAAGFVDVEEPPDTLVSLIFHAYDKIDREGRLPLGAPRGLKIVQTRTIEKGTTTSYSLQFARDQ